MLLISSMKKKAPTPSSKRFPPQKPLKPEHLSES
jgi:hypothetical protein